jgi:molybdenum cofactor biosynthesis protein MoaC
MIDITQKQVSLRTALASGEVVMGAETLGKIRNNALPKGNLLDVAKAAAFLGAKNTAHLIPHCHPVPIESMEVDFEIDDHLPGIRVSVLAKTIYKTGIEMEALTALSIALLTLYDLLKPVDKNLVIQAIRLMEKTGGKSQAAGEIKKGLTAAILVCSDISRAIKDWVDKDIAFIFTTGGTGLSPRDRTVDTIKALLEKEAPGVAEAMRAYGMHMTSKAMHSRSLAGSIQKSLIVCLPGSLKKQDYTGSLYGLVLCGGRSLRMGRDKGLLEFNGKPWVEIVAEKVAGLGLPTMISIRSDQAESYKKINASLLRIPDLNLPVMGPARGILSAAEKFPDRDWLIVSCDMIGVSVDALQRLMEARREFPERDFYYYLNRDIPEPLCAIYTSHGLSLLKLSMQKTMDCAVSADGQVISVLRSFNSPGDIDF